jgi:glycosyltransferase involved in cell wall biosynthesis
MSVPRVSVVVTTYNQRAYVAAAIASALAQTFADREVVVVDDGSTDGTDAIVAAFGDRVRLIRQENRGVAGARNTGVLNARGELVAFLDGDDLWEPEKLALQVEAADRYPQAGLVAADGVIFDDDGSILGPTLLADPVRDALGPDITLMPHGRCYGHLLHQNLISTVSQVLVRRKVLDQVGPSDPRFRLSSDGDLYLRIAAGHDFAFVPRPLVRWRYHARSASGPIDRRHLAWSADDLALLRKQLREGPADRRADIRRALRARVGQTAREAYWYGLARDRAFAARYLLDLLRRQGLRHPGVLTRLLALGLPQALATPLGAFSRALASYKKRVLVRYHAGQ